MEVFFSILLLICAFYVLRSIWREEQRKKHWARMEQERKRREKEEEDHRTLIKRAERAQALAILEQHGHLLKREDQVSNAIN